MLDVPSMEGLGLAPQTATALSVSVEEHRNVSAALAVRVTGLVRHICETYLRMSRGCLRGSNRVLPSFARDQGLVSSRSNGRGVSSVGLMACFATLRNFRCDAALSAFSDSAVVTPRTGVLRFDRAMTVLQRRGGDYRPARQTWFFSSRPNV